MIGVLGLPDEVKRRVREELPWLTEAELESEVKQQLRLIVSQKVERHALKVQEEVENEIKSSENSGQYL